MTLADIPGWRQRSSEGLVELALERTLAFKFVGIELDRRAADEVAARRLVSEYESGAAQPWLTAYLLGCIGHEHGYDTAVAILKSAPGLLAESYAGPAMAKIRGAAALDDLVRLANECDARRSREGAAYGLLYLHDPAAAVAVLRAATTGRVPYSMGAALVNQPLDDVEVARLLSGDERARRVAIAYLERLIDLSGQSGPGSGEAGERLAACRAHWLEPVERLLADADFRMAPRQRAALTAWATLG